MCNKICPELIAPCGFNCALCSAHQKRETQRGYCSGCNAKDGRRQKHCTTCGRKNCSRGDRNEDGFCFSCAQFPCRLMRQLDQRYRIRHNVSMLENLETIQKEGMDAFLEKERARWTCPQCGEILCLFKERCLHCGHAR